MPSTKCRNWNVIYMLYELCVCVCSSMIPAWCKNNTSAILHYGHTCYQVMLIDSGLGPDYLKSQHEWVIISIIKYGMKPLIHSQTFGNVYVTSSHSGLDIWLLGLKLIHIRKRATGDYYMCYQTVKSLLVQSDINAKQYQERDPDDYYMCY